MTSLPPSDFVCPLSKQVMHDPVSTPDGLNFERIAIEGWLRRMNFCPVDGTPLTAASLQANTTLQWKIRFWQWQSKTNDEAPAGSPPNDAKQTQEKASPSATSLTGTNSPPQRFTCPLTNRIMTDPVLSKTGYSFERVALLQWITQRGNVCPVSGKDLPLSHIVTHAALQHEIQGWKKQQQQEALSVLYPVVNQIQEEVHEPLTPVPTSESCPTTLVLPAKTTSIDVSKPTGMPTTSSKPTMSMMKGMLLQLHVPSSNSNSNQHCNSKRNEAETLYQNCNKETMVLDVLRQVELTLGEN